MRNLFTIVLCLFALECFAQPPQLFVAPPVTYVNASTNLGGSTNAAGLGVAIGITNSGSNITVGATFMSVSTNSSSNGIAGALVVGGTSYFTFSSNTVGIGTVGITNSGPQTTVGGATNLAGTTNAGGLGVNGNITNNGAVITLYPTIIGGTPTFPTNTGAGGLGSGGSIALVGTPRDSCSSFTVVVGSGSAAATKVGTLTFSGTLPVAPKHIWPQNEGKGTATGGEGGTLFYFTNLTATTAEFWSGSISPPAGTYNLAYIAIY